MDAPSTRHLIPAHSSLGIFDRFCHPDWIPHKLTRVRAARRETWDIWEGKVLLKAGWVELCRREGRFLVCHSPVLWSAGSGFHGVQRPEESQQRLTHRELLMAGAVCELEGTSISLL
jgi:hypothetical protein